MQEMSEDASYANRSINRKQSNELLMNTSRSPVNCPVTSCPNKIGITAVLSHFLRDHNQKFDPDLQQIASEKSAILTFNEEMFSNFNESICLGVVTYTGKSLDKEARPGLVGLCRPNSFLPEKYSYLAYDLPVLIMACKTSLACLIKDRTMPEKWANPENPEQEIIVIWLATSETSKPFPCTITAFNNQTMTSRSIIIETRSVRYSQEPQTFLSRETNYLRLTRGEINLLTKNTHNEIHLEIFMQDYD